MTTKQLIKSIRIKRFRSFGDEVIEADLLNVYSGKNNAGKSNILKALNLFFNNNTGYDTTYLHSRDYNKAYRGAAGGRREIAITVTFLPTGNGALKHEFRITKRFYDGETSPVVEYDSDDPTIKAEIAKKNGNVTRQFTAFLNRIEYIYIPAVRDKKFVRTLLLNFEDIIKSEASGKDFDDAMDSLSDILAKTSAGISKDFKNYIGIPASAVLSSNASDILGATEINVFSGIKVRGKRKKKPAKDVAIDLFSSGDGIVMAYLVYFLSYLTKKNKKKFIWGYEEPENSLEYSKVQELAEEFYEKFTKDAQIFITTHSPAFINLRNKPNVVMYRVFQRPLTEAESNDKILDRKLTRVAKLEAIEKQLRLLPISDPAYDALDAELHLVEVAKEVEEAVVKIKAEKIELERENDRLRKIVLKKNKLTIVSEGNNIKHIMHMLAIRAPELLPKVSPYRDSEGRTGEKQLKQFFDYEKNKQREKVLFVFDCDVSTSGLSESGKTFFYKFDNNASNHLVAGGIENIYPESCFDTNADFEQKTKVNNDGHTVITKLKKDVFLRKIQDTDSNEDGTFDGYDGLLDKIRQILV